MLIFGALVTVASLLDLEVSKFMTKGSLTFGNYYSSNQFGLLFETIGSFPIWSLGAVAATIFLWNAARMKNKGLGITLAVLCGALVVTLFYLLIEDMLGYVVEKAGVEYLVHQPNVIMSNIFMALIVGGLLIFLWKFINPETNRALLKFALVIVCTAVFYALIEILKSPIGRVRFRAMYAMGDTIAFNSFTDWWVINGKRTLAVDPDAAKSFPSGHTFAAGVIYTIVCLPYLVPSWNKKWVKALLWACAIAYTGTVAVSRIIVGAHYMSDVLFGGTIAFLAAVLFREIFVFKCEHFRALKDLKYTFKKQPKDEPEPSDV